MECPWGCLLFQNLLNETRCEAGAWGHTKAGVVSSLQDLGLPTSTTPPSPRPRGSTRFLPQASPFHRAPNLLPPQVLSVHRLGPLQTPPAPPIRAEVREGGREGRRVVRGGSAEAPGLGGGGGDQVPPDQTTSAPVLGGGQQA